MFASNAGTWAGRTSRLSFLKEHPMPVSFAAGNPGDTRPPVRPELIGVDDVAALLGVSVRHVRRLTDCGKCPQPLRLGRACRWSRRVVEQWIADGCPRIRAVRAGGAA
jgi:excisionase family DNA binding protein